MALAQVAIKKSEVHLVILHHCTLDYFYNSIKATNHCVLYKIIIIINVYTQQLKGVKMKMYWAKFRHQFSDTTITTSIF